MPARSPSHPKHGGLCCVSQCLPRDLAQPDFPESPGRAGAELRKPRKMDKALLKNYCLRSLDVCLTSMLHQMYHLRQDENSQMTLTFNNETSRRSFSQ